MPKPEIKVKIQSREKILYEGPAYAVASENDKGVFSVLPYHANFITLIKTNIKVKTLNGEETSFPVDNGVLRVERNYVEIYIGIKTSAA